MTLYVESANNGVPLGKADIGGGAKADGVLYRYVGSVATYSDLLGLDTSSFKPGYVYDVQEDGMDYSWTGTAWNSLGPRINLSNYYNKTQVDTLLEAKADTEDIPDLSGYYTSAETDVLLDDKADVSDIPDLTGYYNKTQTDTLLSGKADASDIPTVGDGTITFTQGGVTKGTITTNQSGDTEIALDSYALPTASTSTLGGVKVDGITVTIDANGVISSLGGGGGSAYIAGDNIEIESIAEAALPNEYTSSSADLTASSTESSYQVYYAFDGNSATYWGPSSRPTTSNPCWIQRHHDAIKVTSVDVSFREGSEVFSDGEILASNDGTNFTTIGSWSGKTTSDLSFSVPCNAAQTYTYTRLKATATPQYYGKLGEMVIHYSIETVKEISLNSEVTNNISELQQITTDVLPNYTVIGSPTIVSNVASNFSNDDYVKIPVKYNNTNQTWEFKGKMNVPTGAITRSNYYFVDIDESFSSQVDSAIFGITTTRSFSLFLSSNGTSWDIAPMKQSSNNVVPLDTDFYVKVGFTGSKYYLKTSTDDVTYTDRISITSSTPIYNTNSYMCLGSAVKWGDGSSDGPLQGIMYIDECSFTQNGVEIWNGATSTRVAKAYSKAETDDLLNEKPDFDDIPTISFMPTTSTEYGSLTPDSSTLYILTDVGAIYLGDILIAEKNVTNS